MVMDCSVNHTSWCHGKGWFLGSWDIQEWSVFDYDPELVSPAEWLFQYCKPSTYSSISLSRRSKQFSCHFKGYNYVDSFFIHPHIWYKSEHMQGFLKSLRSNAAIVWLKLKLLLTCHKQALILIHLQDQSFSIWVWIHLIFTSIQTNSEQRTKQYQTHCDLQRTCSDVNASNMWPAHRNIPIPIH